MKVSQRIDHPAQRIIDIGYRADRDKGTPYESHLPVIFVSETQEVLAADGRGAPAHWVAAKDLIPGRHVLKLASAHENGPWAEIVSATYPMLEKYRHLPVHELVLVGSDSFAVQDVLCRASSVPAPSPTQKRLVYPLKDFPLINFVPQPKTLSLAHAEVWYRKSAALLPRCVVDTGDLVARVRAMLALKTRMREVAAKAVIETSLRNEFLTYHPLPKLEDLLPNPEQMAPEVLRRSVETAIQALSAPGDRRYSEFSGGMESHHVPVSRNERWTFDGTQWVLTTIQNP